MSSNTWKLQCLSKTPTFWVSRRPKEEKVVKKTCRMCHPGTPLSESPSSRVLWDAALPVPSRALSLCHRAGSESLCNHCNNVTPRKTASCDRRLNDPMPGITVPCVVGGGTLLHQLHSDSDSALWHSVRSLWWVLAGCISWALALRVSSKKMVSVHTCKRQRSLLVPKEFANSDSLKVYLHITSYAPPADTAHAKSSVTL